MAVRKSGGSGFYTSDMPVDIWVRAMLALDPDALGCLWGEVLPRADGERRGRAPKVDVTDEVVRRPQAATRAHIAMGMGWMAGLTRTGNAESLAPYRERLTGWLESEAMDVYGCGLGDLRCVAMTDGEMGREFGWPVDGEGKCARAKVVRDWLTAAGLIVRAVDGGDRRGGVRLASLYVWNEIVWETAWGAVMRWIPDEKVVATLGDRPFTVRGNTIYERSVVDGVESWDAVCMEGVDLSMADDFWRRADEWRRERDAEAERARTEVDRPRAAASDGGKPDRGHKERRSGGRRKERKPHKRTAHVSEGAKSLADDLVARTGKEPGDWAPFQAESALGIRFGDSVSPEQFAVLSFLTKGEWPGAPLQRV